VCDQIDALAVGLGALDPAQRVDDHGAVAVRPVVPATPAAHLHGLFIAPPPDNARLPRGHATNDLGPTQFVQPVVVYPEVVSNLVNDSDRHLLDDVGLGVADVQQRVAKDRDHVGQCAGI
jgi:hypothetical protein